MGAGEPVSSPPQAESSAQRSRVQDFVVVIELTCLDL